MFQIVFPAGSSKCRLVPRQTDGSVAGVRRPRAAHADVGVSAGAGGDDSVRFSAGGDGGDASTHGIWALSIQVSFCVFVPGNREEMVSLAPSCSQNIQFRE